MRDLALVAFKDLCDILMLIGFVFKIMTVSALNKCQDDCHCMEELRERKGSLRKLQDQTKLKKREIERASCSL